MFEKFFKSDNPVWGIMGNIFDIFVLNVLWIICSIPIITVGPATTALHYALINMILEEGDSPSKSFFKSFKQNFRQGAIIGGALIMIFIMLGFDIYLCYYAGRGIYSFFIAIFSVLFILALFISMYIFPLLAKLEKSIFELVLLSFTLSIKYPLKTILMIFSLIVGSWLIHLLPGLVFINIGIIAYVQSNMVVSILRKYSDVFEIKKYEEE